MRITTKSLEGLATDRAVANHVIAAIVAQGVPAFDDATGSCRYRAVDGSGETRACAAGQLIANRYYRPSMEGTVILPNPKTASALIFAAGERVRAAVTLSMCHEPNWRLLRELQSAHDDAGLHMQDRFVQAFLQRVAAILAPERWDGDDYTYDSAI